MMLLYNKLCLAFFWSLKILGRGHHLKKKIFKCSRLLELNFKTSSDFSFIQVGANDGVSFDSLYDFVINRKSKGVVIEPIVSYFTELKENYKEFPDIIKVNKAIHKTEKSLSIYKIDETKSHKYPEWVKGIASFDKNHHLKTGISTEDILLEKVSADTLMHVIDENYNYEQIDFFQVDTEGYDYEILKMLNFNKIKPSIIKFESMNLSNEQIFELELLLKRFNFFIFNEKGDTIALQLNEVRLI
jgi:FkbM family methyltransferase